MNQMEKSLIAVHAGGWNATQAEISAVRIPESTGSYCAIPYGELVGQVKDILPRFHFDVTAEQYALAADGMRFFGVIKVSNGQNRNDLQLAIGLRSSYDKSIAPSLVAGTSVFVCDNLAFSGAIEIKRKQTVFSWRDIDHMVFDMIRRIDTMFASTVSVYDQLKEVKLTDQVADHLLMTAVRARALPASIISKVDLGYRTPDEKWDTAFGERTAWRLFNSFTEVYKSRNAWQCMTESQRLHRVFADTLKIEPVKIGAVSGDRLN